MLSAIDRARTVVGFIGIPNMDFCLNMVSRPPVVDVAVVAEASKTILKENLRSTLSTQIV